MTAHLSCFTILVCFVGCRRSAPTTMAVDAAGPAGHAPSTCVAPGAVEARSALRTGLTEAERARLHDFAVCEALVQEQLAAWKAMPDCHTDDDCLVAHDAALRLQGTFCPPVLHRTEMTTAPRARVWQEHGCARLFPQPPANGCPYEFQPACEIQADRRRCVARRPASAPTEWSRHTLEHVVDVFVPRAWRVRRELGDDAVAYVFEGDQCAFEAILSRHGFDFGWDPRSLRQDEVDIAGRSVSVARGSVDWAGESGGRPHRAGAIVPNVWVPTKNGALKLVLHLQCSSTIQRDRFMGVIESVVSP